MSDWRGDWDGVVGAVGTDFGDGIDREGAETVELGLIRRFLEVLEFDCPLHHDEEVARAHGYPGVLAPSTLLRTFTFPAAWAPGDEPNFTSAERDAQPERTVLAGDRVGLEPPFSDLVQADLAIEFLALVVVGDRLTWPGRHRLLACTPKETSIGRGAFIRSRTEVRNQRGDLVARFTGTAYAYIPHDDG